MYSCVLLCGIEFTTEINLYLTITYTHYEKDVKWNMFGGNQKHKANFRPLTLREDIKHKYEDNFKFGVKTQYDVSVRKELSCSEQRPVVG